MSESPANFDWRAEEDLSLDSQSLHLPTDLYDRYAACNPGMLMRTSIQALITVRLFATNIREDQEMEHIWRSPWDFWSPSTKVSVPTSTSILFHLMMDVPLPFSPNAAINFASCHLAKMTTADFLEDGDWAGFYSVPYRRGISPSFDPPMRGIHFVVTANTDGRGLLVLQSRGEDSVGTFDLEGILAPETGYIAMSKTYSGGSPMWDWFCVMTSVGIVGSWGGGGTYGGGIWLWKTSWTPDHHA